MTDKLKILRCAVYTRVSTDAGLEQDFNSLDAQREASEAYIKSQTHEGWKLIKAAYDDGGFSGGTLQRPALQKLLDDVRAGQVDIIVVYKVDRLTRSLADFAKLVELFDAHRASFVSVTQSFNTTTSMGRLTLNVLLSFAQFEREVTGERIRDKVAASKKKGIWMGGAVPLGYRVENRKLLIVPEEASIVCMVFERYLALGSLTKLVAELRKKMVTTRRRFRPDGTAVGGVPFTVGPLSHLLKNRVYIGEIVHKGQSYPGEHQAILDKALFDAVETKLADNLNGHRAKRAASNALLIGKLFDDAGNLMSPSQGRKNGHLYRYYTSRALLEGRKHQAGVVPRVGANDIENTVVGAVKNAVGDFPALFQDDARALIAATVTRVDIHKDRLTLTFSPVTADALQTQTLAVTWSRKPTRPKRELILPVDRTTANPRPLHAERRAKSLRAIALGHRWLQELVDGNSQSVEDIAAREGRSIRSVQMTISLAFVSPDIVEAAVAGRLPRGIGITRLIDLPEIWAEQKRSLGLPERF